MNERIYELALQAEIAAHNGDHVDVKIMMAKFGALIVKECMELASKEQKRYASITHRNMSECAVALGNFSLLMEDHFGVEE